MPWKYLPVAIRIKSRHDLIQTTYSGILLLNLINDAVNESRVVFIYHGSDLSSKLVYVSTPQLLYKESLTWNQAVITKEENVFESHNDELFNGIKYSVANGFNFFPLDTYMGNSLLTSLKIVQLSVKFFSNEKLSLFQPFYTKSPVYSESIVVRSCPFSDSNPAIFADFKSHGTISQVIGAGGDSKGYMSDLKFLDNMTGGVATSSDGAVVGLVLGNLRKLNGDGDLTVILPWKVIAANLSSMGSTLNISHGLTLSNPSCLFPIFLDQNKERISWGSCVLINKTTLVTNLHVVDPFLQNEDIRCRVSIEKDNYIDINRSDVNVPFRKLDLAFINLKEEQQNLIRHLPAKLGTSLPEGEVYSVGYGLFYNDQLQLPLISRGRVSALKVTRALRTGSVIPTMTISSSSCWNGSSGGGLFNSDEELVGIICSNAQVFVPSAEGNSRKGRAVGNAKQTEKVPLFCLSIPIELVMACYDLSQIKTKEYLSKAAIDLWNLEHNVKDIYNRSLKL